MNRAIEEKCKEVIEYRFSDPQRAYEICCQLLKQGSDEENSYLMAYARLYMGDTLFSMGDLKEALDNMRMAEKLQRKYGYEELLMKNCNITAIIYANQGDGLLALDYYYMALKLAKKRDDTAMQAMIYNNIGELLHKVGDMDGATRYLKMAFEMCKKREEKEKKKIYNKKQYCINIADGCIVKKDYAAAKKFRDMAADEEGSETDTVFPASEVSWSVHNIKLCYYTGERQRAVSQAEKMLDLPREAYKEVESFWCFIELVKVLISMQEYQKAGKLLEILDEDNNEDTLLKRRVELLKAWIRYCKATGAKRELQKCYRNYYELKKIVNEQEKDLIVRAIDNRYKLEYEKMTNEQLSANAKELMKTSEVDELTGISNRYGLKKKFNKLCEISRFQKSKICLCIFDIDKFKVYNDEYGHLKGDECLKEISELLVETVGEEYFVSRYGGDEFVILGLDKSDAELRRFIEKLFDRINAAKMPFLKHKGFGTVTISMGAVNKLAEKEYSLADFIHNADRNLYLAKKNGKNRYVLG